MVELSVQKQSISSDIVHRSSYHIMHAFINKYLNIDDDLMIYDIGSRAVSGKGGCYKALFENACWHYCGVDITAGANVDHVLEKEYEWDIKTDSVDVVISGQCLEHVEYFWLTMQEMQRVLKPGGLLCIIVPSQGREHRHPVDCWRFLPDGMNALAKYVGMEVLQCEHPEQADGKWKDTLLVARKLKE